MKLVLASKNQKKLVEMNDILSRSEERRVGKECRL